MTQDDLTIVSDSCDSSQRSEQFELMLPVSILHIVLICTKCKIFRWLVALSIN